MSLFVYAVGVTIVSLQIAGIHCGIASNDLQEELRLTLARSGKSDEEIHELFYGPKSLKIVLRGQAGRNIFRIAKEMMPESPLLRRVVQLERRCIVMLRAGLTLIAGTVLYDFFARR